MNRLGKYLGVIVMSSKQTKALMLQDGLPLGTVDITTDKGFNKHSSQIAGVVIVDVTGKPFPKGS